MPDDSQRTEKFPPWRELFDHYKDAPYGTIIPYHEITEKTHIQPYRKGWIFTIEKFKAEMLQNQKRALENLKGRGYRIVNPNEHSRLTYRESLRAERRLRQGVKLTVNIDYDQLTDAEKVQITNLQARMMTLHSFQLKGTKQLKKIALHFELPETPRPTLPPATLITPEVE